VLGRALLQRVADQHRAQGRVEDLFLELRMDLQRGACGVHQSALGDGPGVDVELVEGRQHVGVVQPDHVHGVGIEAFDETVHSMSFGFAAVDSYSASAMPGARIWRRDRGRDGRWQFLP